MKTYLLFLALLVTVYTYGQQKPDIGIAENLENDSIMHASGYHCMVESISKWFSPLKVTDDQFKANLAIFSKLKTPFCAGYIFFPGELKLVGPDVNEQAILSYVRVVFQRCGQAGISLISWGSGGARRVPEGFDKKKATEQFIAIAKKVAAIASEYHIILAVENLNSTETNFINTLAEAIDVVRRVDHPNLRLCIDVYHMLKENEPASVILQAKGIAVHCDIAEKENRTPPGVAGQDFREYLQALKKIDYKGRIIIEARWNDLGAQALPAREYLKKQIDEVYR